MTVETSTYVSRHIAELIDTTLLENVTITRYGENVAQFTSRIPPDFAVRRVTMTEFLATIGHWLKIVRNGESVILTRRKRAVVAIIPIE
jgi:antitoxin (DNA-binding transcriptional repressor) of toxin-antitoxin stability system